MKMIDLRQYVEDGSVVSFEPFKIKNGSIFCRRTIETHNEIVIEGFYKYDMNTREFTRMTFEENRIDYFSPWYYDSDNLYYITSSQKDDRDLVIFNQINLNTEISVALMILEIPRDQHCHPIEIVDGHILYSITYDNNFKRAGSSQCRTFLFDVNSSKHYELMDKSINLSCEVYNYNGNNYLLSKRCAGNGQHLEYACSSCSTRSFSSSTECYVSIAPFESFLSQVKSHCPGMSGLMNYSSGPNCSLNYLGMNDTSIFYINKDHRKQTEELLEIKKSTLQTRTYKLPRSYSDITVSNDRVLIFHENDRMNILRDVLDDSLILTYPKSFSPDLRFEAFSGFTEGKFIFVNSCESKGNSLSYYCKIYDIDSGIGIRHNGRIQELDEFMVLY